jgi:hypothetical protein
MATRWNGTDLQEDNAFEQGLVRRLRGRKTRDKEVFYYFELMRRIRQIAQHMSRRDDELIEAVVRRGTLSGAARDLAPDRAEALRCYLSQRLRKFRELEQIFFADLDPERLPNPRGKDLGPARLRPKSPLDRPIGHSGAVRRSSAGKVANSLPS